MATPVHDESVQLTPLDQRLLRYIQRAADVGSRGPCQSDLLRSTNERMIDVQQSLARLKEAGLIKVSASGRYYPVVPDEPPVTSRRLTDEELERVLRGEPSTGQPFGCSGLPSGIIAPLMEPPPTRVVATDAPGRRQRVSDLEIIEALRRYPTQREAARALGLSPSGFSRRARQLGFGNIRMGRPPKVSDEEILRVLRQTAARLGISPNTLWRRLRRIALETGA